MYMYVLASALFLIFSLLCAAIFIRGSKKYARGTQIVAFATSAIFAILISAASSLYLHNNQQLFLVYAIAISLSILTSGAAIGYGRRKFMLVFVFASIALALLELFITHNMGQYATGLPIGIAGVGFSIGLIYRSHEFPKEDRSKRNTRLEIHRDMLQVAIGIIAILIIAYVGAYQYVIFFLGICLYLANGISNKSRGIIYDFLSRLERNDIEFGRGAAYLAAGAMIIVGFSLRNLALFGICTLIIGDAIATIIGITLYSSRRLPYNRRKTYAGTIAFFAISSIAGILTVGILGILIAAALALIESIDTPLDDNILLPIAFVILKFIII